VNLNDGVTTQRPKMAPPREIHLSDLWAVVVRRWKLVALLSLLVAGGAYLSGRRAIPQHQSRLTVQVSSSKQVFARTDDIDIDELALRTDPILSEALVLTTQDLALRVVRALDLQLEVSEPTLFRGDVFAGIHLDSVTPTDDYTLVVGDRFELRSASGELIDSGSLTDEVSGPGFAFRIAPTAPRGQHHFRIVRPQVAAAWVSAGVGYRVRDATNAVDITFTGVDPTLVPLVLNQAAIELRRDGAERARERATRKRQYVQEQLARADAAFQAKLSELQRFKERNLITDLSIEERSIIDVIRNREMQRQEVLVQTAALRDAARVGDSIGIEVLNRLAAARRTSDNTVLTYQIHRLLELYDERRTLTAGALGLREGNPQIEALNEQISQGHASLRTAMDAAIQSLDGRRESIQREIAELRGQLLTYPGKESQIAQLELEANILNDTYRYLLGQFEQTRMQEATISPYVTILDGASPPVLIGTNLRQKIVLGLLVGLLLGLGAVFFLEYLDQTIKTAADVERTLGMPVLGLIPFEPKIERGTNGRGSKRVPTIALSNLDPHDPVTEAYRALRTNVTFVGAEKPVQLLVVTSPGPGEGKSTTATNLAIMLSQGGTRTLLIDGDLRRPGQHRAFGLVQEPGLTDILVGNADVREAIRPSVAKSLDLLPAGPCPPNPAELLGSEAMQHLLGELRQDYTYIILDTPPTLPVTDAMVAAASADAAILVMRSGETEEQSARRAVEQLARVRTRIAGVVLNGLSKRYDQHYSYYNRKYPYGRSRFRVGNLRSRFANFL
jgi:tyrosine-protein kinase Etk/Wzc